MNGIERDKFMDAAEVKKLRSTCEAHALADLRAGRITAVVQWAVVDTALSTGLRVGELAKLTCGDVDLRRGSLRVCRLKRKKTKQELLALGDDLWNHLKDFMAWKEAVGQGVKAKAPLFCSKRDGPLPRRGIQQMFKSVIKRTGLPSELSIHSCRHTLAVYLLKKTGNLRQVQKQLGHSSPAITANMYADISFEDMQAGLNGLYDDQPKG